MAGLITVAELIARPGFENIDSGQAQALIDDASALVRDEARGLLDDVVSPDAPPAVVAVMVNMIRRGWSNPMGHQSENLGDYAYTAGTSMGVATLYLTQREKRIVRRAVGRLSAGSLTMTGTIPDQASDEFYGTTGLDDGIVL
jgi:hypothetical protein